MSLQRIARQVSEAKANWLEDVIGGLLINGVTLGEIEIQEHLGCTRVAVRGEPRYEFRIT